MKLRIERAWKKSTYTIGRLFIDGVRFCETLEDRDRGLTQDMTPGMIASKNVPGETAIPTGTYVVSMDIVSPKYSAISWYKNLCGGKMPRLMNVPGYEGILIHPGTTALDSSGCVLVGKNKIKGGLVQSKDTFKALYNKLAIAHKKGEQITVEIV